jgi:hypothetical protein
MSEKIDWNGILSYKEISTYLGLFDSTELSICNSKLRDKIYYSRFKPFQVREYLKREDFRTFEVEVEGERDVYENPYQPLKEDIQENVNQFEIELQALNPTVETLIIHDIYDFTYGYKIVDKFVNIKTLILDSCTITTEVFRYLLNNLKLTELSIKSIAIIGKELYHADVVMPQSLKKIEIINSSYCIVDQEDNFIYFCKKNYAGESGSLNIIVQKIKSLNTIDYKGRYKDLSKFFELNPQLKSITLRQHELNQQEVVLLIKNNQIEHLDSEYAIKPPCESGPHIFESLKSLVIMIWDDINFALNISKSCPNLTKLTTRIYSIQSINCSISYASQLKSLERYALKPSRNQIFKDPLDLPVMNELTELELTNFSPKSLDWIQLSLFPKLKMVKFFGYYVENNCKSFVPEIQNTKTWKLVSIGNTMTYHKL